MFDAHADWSADELGPFMTTLFRLPTGHSAAVVIDNLTLGPALGGVRLSPTVTAGEVARLARAMTVKNAVAGVPYGGAKAGIRAPEMMPGLEKESLIRAFARAISQIRDYTPGPDMGTDETAMAWIHDEIGRAVGLPASLGGVPLDELGATGYGLAVCAEALQDAGELRLDGARAVVQGFGAVGRHAAIQLAERGVRIIAVSDRRGAVYDPDGLEVEKLAIFAADQTVRDFPDGEARSRDEILFYDCDLLIPAAVSDVFDIETAEQVRAAVILQGANIPATPGAEAIFHRRGILSVPDVIANAGGVICAAVERRGGGRGQAFVEIADRIRPNVDELLRRIRFGALTPREAADAMAHDRLAAARRFRRRF